MARFFMSGLEPVELLAATGDFNPTLEKPVFNHGNLLMDINWGKVQLLYLYKILILVIIVVVAVLNYKSFVAEEE